MTIEDTISRLTDGMNEMICGFVDVVEDQGLKHKGMRHCARIARAINFFCECLDVNIPNEAKRGIEILNDYFEQNILAAIRL